MPNTAVELQAM